MFFLEVRIISPTGKLLTVNRAVPIVEIIFDFNHATEGRENYNDGILSWKGLQTVKDLKTYNYKSQYIDITYFEEAKQVNLDEINEQITKLESSLERRKNLLNNENYVFTCLDYNLNHNWKFLDTLTPIEKQKTEFLVNPICMPGCL